MQICGYIWLLLLWVLTFYLYTVCAQCTSITATNTTQYIQSHSSYSSNGSSTYGSNIDICWVITTLDSNKIVRLYRPSNYPFSLEPYSSYLCSYDKLKVYDSSTDSGTSVNFCGLNIFTYLYSSGRYMYIRFTTDPLKNYRGFKLSVTEISSSYYNLSRWQNSYYNYTYSLSSTDIFLYSISGITLAAVLCVLFVSICVFACCYPKVYPEKRKVGVFTPESYTSHINPNPNL